MIATVIPIHDAAVTQMADLRHDNLRLRMARSTAVEALRDCRPTFDTIARCDALSEHRRGFGRTVLMRIDRAIAAAEAAGGSNE